MNGRELEVYAGGGLEPADLFQCGRCELAFTDLTVFLQHKRERCGRVTPADNEAPAGNEAPSCPGAPTAPGVFTCPVCGKRFKKPGGLALHARAHAGERPFQCAVCGKCFTQSTHLRRHAPAHRVWPARPGNTVPRCPDAPLGSYACCYCDTELSDYGTFRIHLKTHNDQKMYKCVQDDCTSLFREIEPLLHHVRESHSNPIYRCPLCSLCTGSLEELSKHQQNHGNIAETPKVKEKYNCLHCDASFSKKEKLTFHMATYDHVSTCARCGKRFSSEKRLRSHLRTHGEEKSFHCNICGASFFLKKYLTTHLLKHGERQYACTLCALKFKRKDMLGRHLKIHQPRKKMECPFKDELGCKSQFSRSDKLKLHIKCHVKWLANKPKTHKNIKDKNTSTVEIVIIPVNSVEQ